MGVGGTLWNPRNLLRGLVAGGCNAPNALLVPYRLELIHSAH
jgi:hypothetical protein